MPPTKDQNAKQGYMRSFSDNGMTMSARVFHPATNLNPISPPQSPTGQAPSFPPRPPTNWGRQNSTNSKNS